MRSHIGSPKAMRPVNFRRGWGEFHSVAKQASFYIASGTDFRRFRKPKSMPKFDLRVFFSDVIFEQKFASKFAPILEAQNQKNSYLPLEKQ